MPINFTILGSGSGGNCTYVETPRARVLIDAGFSGRQIAIRMECLGKKIEDLTAIVLTHEHSDHTIGLNVLCNKLQLPLYCNRLTADAIAPELPKFKNFRLFSTGNSFDIEDLHFENFSVPHDAYDPVGFLITTHDVKIGFLTDLGHATKLVIERIRQANVLVLEANHDVRLVHEDKVRPWSVKQRILSRHGHLSNDAAAEVLKEIMSENLKHLYLGHLSRDCNRPELAEKAARKALAETGASHIPLTVTSQHEASASLLL